ncbi:hypothetical protein Acr_02g0004240 [Actinidia rufa]|uniref:Phorbol-ester/DAG-type domain-containing protein n=1 Tax=Actinidia rufa TaxID=165716 RepID=A0A7J0E6R5_9ERIC|nr:hypothetical protein Acr_02g0004240 [Actinidia rufa]
MSIVKRIYRELSELGRHEHEFKLESYNKRFTCAGCKKQGFGSRYKCEHCSYELHPECKCRKPTVTHDFFPGSVFEFLEQPHILGSCGRICDACGKDIHGFVYHCRANDWDLHPCCSKLEKELRIDDTDFILCDKVTSKCMWCKNKKLCGTTSHVPGWSYVSGCGKYHFHVCCVAKMEHKAWHWVEVDESGSGSGTVKIFLKIIVAILFITLGCVLFDVVSK